MSSLSAYFFGILWSLGLPVGVPSADVVTAIEHRLSNQPCVGSLQGWHRNYQFQKRGAKIDRSFVSIHYVRAGHNGLPAGRFVSEPENLGIDDSQHLLVFAEYEIATGRITEWVCGWNFPWRSGSNDS